MTQTQLSQDEAAAIHLYTMETLVYPLLNSKLRERDREQLKPWFAYLKLLLTALFKLPLSTNKILWRGVKLDLSKKYKIGEEYVWWSFTSCTTAMKVLDSDLYLGKNGVRTLFAIECINGRSIVDYSYFKQEDEILLLPGTYFQVVDYLSPNSTNDLHIIQLRQIEPPVNFLQPPFNVTQEQQPTTMQHVPMASSNDMIVFTSSLQQMSLNNQQSSTTSIGSAPSSLSIKGISVI
ncbi:unnamed protein product [Didymodactylos carnosus]|uniref:NAD(P)(+)--arginine ADP-ribosyltransferase n=1 Tax=Didymodactylos carnosus TaxID=1234261 RepID=A0A815YC31_9BILA|nr:unnamed protein product [Didymodactylos carnosus]CAF4430729.1 unnamed protein product [Didymodactylos carnosus]